MARPLQDAKEGSTHKTVSVRFTIEEFTILKAEADQRTAERRFTAARALADSDSGAKALVKAAETLGTVDQLAASVSLSDLIKERSLPKPVAAVAEVA